MKKCPFCAENIQDEALICRYCGRELDIAATLLPEDRKKCPFCAEWIRKDAIICRYCKRDLSLEDTKPNPRVKRDGERQVVQKKSELTLQDFGALMESWGESYVSLPQEAMEPIVSSASKVIRGYMTAIMGQFLRHRLANDSAVKGSISQTTAISYQWAFLCFAIGVEGSRGNTQDQDTPYYLIACTRAFNLHLLSFLETLLAKGKLKENQAIKIASQLTTDLNNTAVFLANQGFVFHQSVKPKYEAGQPSPLATQLNRIDVAKIKESNSR